MLNLIISEETFKIWEADIMKIDQKFSDLILFIVP